MSLQSKLGGILILGLCLALGGQLLTHRLLEIPVLEELENQSDAKDIERVRQTIIGYQKFLSRIANDYGAWTDTYEFIRMKPDDPEFISYVDTNFDNYALMALGSDGAIFYNELGEIIYEVQRDHLRVKQELPFKSLPINSSVDPALVAAGKFDNEFIGAGLFNTPLGPAIITTSHIVSHDLPYPMPRGVVLFWRMFDESLIAEFENNLQAKLRFVPIDEAKNNFEFTTRLATILQDDLAYLPRNNGDKLYWVLRDMENQPIFLVEQLAGKRIFSDELLPKSVMVAFSISALLLLILMLIFSRLVIRRLSYAKETMLKITNNGDYESRLDTTGKDEIDDVFRQFNTLLAHVSRQNRELSELSNQDALTGISNRRHLDEVLNRTWRQCARSKSQLSVLMIDIDYFKLYNDEYGHPAGDQVLTRVAQTFQHNLHRATDYLARYGGEEFCVVLTNTEPGAAVSVAERLRQEIFALHIPSAVSKCADCVTVSIGVASFVPDASVVELDIIKAADEALYQAKEQGRNCVYSSAGEEQESTAGLPG